jgi:septation ring formation regulator EzrA
MPREKESFTNDELLERVKQLEKDLENAEDRARRLANKLNKIREALEGMPGLPAAAYKLLR